ncbi:hypothetical protein H6P81_020414 [Aristolochia fimbriata]|uniref:Transposase MuDR plant domain-containing protein n=1 Tax=Aristolochia fimbriata TaxID=158543 RepID=A0AAV7DVH6_ARIFI|nr:hypothetical protein H6P81_020414 [Aristolochia fimbriata]
MVKHGFQSMLELFVKQDTYSYEMDSRRGLENVGGTGEGAVMVYAGQAPAEGDERVERPIAEFIPEEREPSEEANDNSSSEGSWPELVIEEDIEEEEDVELPLPTMGVPHLEENDESYPDPWIGVMDMDVTYRNTMVPGVDDDNVPPPVGVGVGQRFMTKDALVMYLKDYCISRHVQFRVHKSGSTIYSVRCTGDQCPWHVYASFSMKLNMWKIRRCNDEHTCLNVELRMDNRLCTSRHRFCIRHIVANLKKRYSVKDLNKMVWRCASAETVAHYDHEMQILEEACPGAKAELIEDMSPEQWALAYDGNMSFGKLTTNSSKSVNSLLKRARSLPVQVLASAIFYRMNAWFVHRRDKAAQITTHLCPSVDAHLRTVVDDARHVHVVAYGDGIFPAGEHKVVMADAPLLYDQDSHRSEAIWHGEGSADSFVGVRTSTYWTSDTPRGTGAIGWPFRFQVERPTDECHKPWWKLGAIQDRVGPLAELSGKLLYEEICLPAICVEGRRIWLSRTPLICFEIVELHVPDRVMLQFRLEQLGCVRNVVERVNHRAALYPSSTDPHWLEIGHYCQSVLHSLPLLEGAIVGGDESHAGEPSHVVEPARDRAPRRRRARRRPTAEMTTPVEDSDKVPAVPEPTVLDLPPQQTPDTEPGPPLEQPLEQPIEQPIEQPQEEPNRHPPIRRIYTRRQKKAIGAPEPSSAL